MFWPIIFAVALAVALLFAWLMGFEAVRWLILELARLGKRNALKLVNLVRVHASVSGVIAHRQSQSSKANSAPVTPGLSDRPERRPSIFTGGSPFARTQCHRTSESGKLRTSLARLNPELLAVNSIVRRIV
jgi:hypothetical protein